jgi:hypothetical protein
MSAQIYSVRDKSFKPHYGNVVGFLFQRESHLRRKDGTSRELGLTAAMDRFQRIFKCSSKGKT